MSNDDQPGGGKPVVAIVGGGISGLTVAFELMERSERVPGGIDFICLEASDRPGGKIHSLRRNGFVCECGPTGFLDNAPATLTLVRRLGLQDRMVSSRLEQKDRFIFRKGRLRRVPGKPQAFLGSDLLPLSGKLRLMAEPLIVPRRGEADESVFDFMRRRMGRQAASLIGDAMVTGVYAGDARSLSMMATFPEMSRMEAEHGSLFKGMLARRRRARRSGGPAPGPTGVGGNLTTFVDGMEELTRALASRLGNSLRLNALVAGVGDMGRRGFRVQRGEGAPLDVSAVVLACPAHVTADVVRETDGELSEALSAIPWAPIAVVHLGYRESDLADRFRGFGFLAPRDQGLRLLGTVWASSVFEARAPEGRVLMTSLVGGAHDPDAVDLPDSELVEIVRRDLEAAMGVTAEPDFVAVLRQLPGLPQYTLGHLDRVAAIEAGLRRHPGLFVCGWSYRGIAVNSCVQEAAKIAEEVLTHLSRAGER